jgi:hypothetical protein
MFVRFRDTPRRLQVSLVATRRDGGRVRHDHLASLGSVPAVPSPDDRITFWTRLHQRLGALSNRIDPAQAGSILAAIHARIPMPTPLERQALQIERARADAQFWESVSAAYADDIEGHRELLATTQRAIAARETKAAEVAAKAQAARDRLARAEQGEDVGTSRPLTRADLRRIIPPADQRDAARVAEVADVIGVEAIAAAAVKAQERARKRVIRTLHQKLCAGRRTYRSHIATR